MGREPRSAGDRPRRSGGPPAEAVAGARRAADAVVVLLHWGVERSGASAGDQVRPAHSLVDAGAAAVVGHHPHLPQRVVRYRGALIDYSLGNFVFTAPEATQESMILRPGVLPDRTVAAAAVPARIVRGRPEPGWAAAGLPPCPVLGAMATRELPLPGPHPACLWTAGRTRATIPA